MKGGKIWYILCAAIFLSGVVGGALLILAPRGEWVDILQDGNMIYHINLSEAEDETFSIEYGGGYNIIEIKDKKIRVIEADCPDKTCIHMGNLGRDGFPIVCVPNRLVIRFSAESGYTDAVAG